MPELPPFDHFSLHHGPCGPQNRPRIDNLALICTYLPPVAETSEQPETPEQPEPPTATAPTPETIAHASSQAGDAVRAAATATPNSGGVIQSSNVDGTNVTTDTTRTVFNGQDVEVIVTHEGSISTTLSTETDFVLGNTGTAPSPIRPGYSHQQRTVGNIVGDDITIAVVETDWDPGNPTDYATFGYWLKVKDYSTPSPRPQIGAFLDGPEFRGSPIVPVSGSASYRGRSRGFYVGVAGSNTLIPTGSLATGEFFADATLVADFGTSMIGGTIDNIETVESAVSPQGQVLYLNQPGIADYLLTLGNTPIGNGKFVDSINLSSLSRSVTSSDGKWGGQLSNRPVSTSDGDPRTVGGTFGGGFTEADGSQATYIGVFGATKQ